MPQHEDYDAGQIKWYCSGWQSKLKWLDTHGYIPKKQRKLVFENDAT